MDILQRIIKDIKEELPYRKRATSEAELRERTLYQKPRHSLSASLASQTTGILAEHKRRSPSKKEIQYGLNITEVARAYQQSGAAGMSVLTNQKYFGGSLEDLTLARMACDLPLLRKEFVVDPYQIAEARAYGADAILLIAAALPLTLLEDLAGIATEQGLEVLLEVHDAQELAQCAHIPVAMVGVNNRNLKTFEVSLETSKQLSEVMPKDVVTLSESGISGASEILELKQFGFKGFLIGEHFMRGGNPGESLSELLNQCNVIVS